MSRVEMWQFQLKGPGAVGYSKAAWFASLTALMRVIPAWAQYVPDNHYYGYGRGMMWDGSWFGPLFGLLMMAVAFTIIVVLFVAVIWWLVSLGLGGHRVPPSTRPSAMDILKERFARGEIDLDEFEERKWHLVD